jgi:phosphoenolpyruvate synthase/pyruvate phosphate dikinase
VNISKINKLSKGQVLVYLSDVVKRSKIPKTLVFTVNLWKKNQSKILREISSNFIKIKFLAIRSSALNEDTKDLSQAGKYHSELFVKLKNEKEIINAINKVINSYEKKNIDKNEFIVQEMLIDTNVSGVVFTKDPNTNAQYYVINYDDSSGLTDSVTSGKYEFSNKALNVHRTKIEDLRSTKFKKLILSIKELENIFLTDELDVEFCIKNLQIYIIQVRLMTKLKQWNNNKTKLLNSELKKIKKKIENKSRRLKGTFGKTNVFGQMPDWNPAEIIGLNPRPLAYSIYKKVITDRSWAKARYEMGYKKPSDLSLMLNFGGLPYINTKLSFNSFLPKTLNNKISEKLVNHWLKRLKDNPILHDKIEFEIAVTCFSFDIDNKFKILLGNNLNSKEKTVYKTKLKNHFINLISENHKGSIKRSLEKIKELENIQKQFKTTDGISKIIIDCINLGTIPFSILARHAFISKTILNSLHSLGILTANDLENFYSNVSTVSTDFINDVHKLKKKEISKIVFNNRYGHLRPGTYDILSKRYDETNYINFGIIKKNNNLNTIFNKLSKKKDKKISSLLSKYSIPMNTKDLFSYASQSTSLREYAKFIFSKSISHLIKIIQTKGKAYGFTNKDLSFLELDDVIKNLNKKNKITLRNKIHNNKKKYTISNCIKLPQIIHDKKGAYIAPFQINVPNFVTNKRIVGETLDLQSHLTEMTDNKIVVIENADPGYDWIFTYKIKGLVTKYGGINSHMAIRCREFNLPAAIGCGEQIYKKIITSKKIIMDCSVNKIEII